MSLRLFVEQRLCLHPDPQHQRKNTLPAATVGRLRAQVHVACLGHGLDDLGASDAPQEQRQRFTHAVHEVFAFGRSQKQRHQRHLGRLEPTPYLTYRVEEVLRRMPMLST